MLHEHYYKQICKIKNLDIERLIDAITKTYLEDDTFIKLVSFEMDFYFVLKTMVTYEDDKMDRGPNLCRNLKEPKNIIFNAGFEHCKNSFNLLNEYYGVENFILHENYESKVIELDEEFDFFKGIN
jgi:hypothetical protein